MASGVKVDEECQTLFSKIKAQKSPYGYVIFKIEDEKLIVVEKKGEKDKTYEDFVKELIAHDGECRYGLFDYEYQKKCEGAGEATISKLVFFSWCPDLAKIKKKMLYSSSLDAFKKGLVGLKVHVQANDLSDLERQEVEDQCRKFDRS